MADKISRLQDRKVMRLDELGIIVTGKTPSTKIPDHFDGDTPFITPSDMDGRRIISKTMRYLTAKGVLSVSGAQIPKGAIMVSCIGSDMGKVAIAGRAAVTNQQINSIIVSKDFSNLYVYYNLCMRKAEFQHLASGGSALPILNKRHFSQLQIAIPPLKEQQAIACILGALDDRIELNRRMNRTLEEMARALFKSWFVDFEPVRYKAAGQPPPGLAPDIAALFPDSFQDSELGEIPKGWNITPLGKICELAYGKGLKTSERRPGKVPVMGSNGQVGWHDEALVRGPGIIVGRKGNPGIVTWIQSDFFPIDTTFYVNTKIDHVPLTYLFFALKYLNLQNLGADSAVPGLNRNIAYMSKLLLPFPYILDNFNKITFVLFEKIYKSDQLNIDLINLRDALLPKLISGELRVPDAERIVGRCT